MRKRPIHLGSVDDVYNLSHTESPASRLSVFRRRHYLIKCPQKHRDLGVSVPIFQMMQSRLEETVTCSRLPNALEAEQESEPGVPGPQACARLSAMVSSR